MKDVPKKSAVPNDGKTHFGFRSVDAEEKSKLVGAVFSSVASRYDVMNDVMSFGSHKLWKQFAAMKSGLREGQSVLDIAGGSGDMAQRFVHQVGDSGRVVLTDINPDMLQQGKSKMIDSGWVSNIEFQLADAENLPFDENVFHCNCIAFGLRNVTYKERALASMYRVLRPGGRSLMLEFSKPTTHFLNKLYDLYSFKVIPKMGRLIANDEQGYQYLVESIRQHPSQQVIKQMMLDAGYDEVKIYNLAAGIVALHVGFKY